MRSSLRGQQDSVGDDLRLTEIAEVGGSKAKLDEALWESDDKA